MLVAGIVVFAALNLQSAPHVRRVSLVGNEDNAELRNQRIKINFTRPIAKDYKNNIKEYLTITPEIDFKPVWTGNQLTIILNEPLLSANGYEVKLSKDIEDTYGDKFAKDFIYQFKTRNQKLYFIERNYPDGKDKIIETDVSLSSKTQIYTSELEILKFSKKDNYLAVVESHTNKGKRLKLTDLKEGKTKQVMPENEDVFQAKFSERSHNLYILSQKFSIEDNFMVPEAGRMLYVYNLDNEQLRELKLGNNFLDIDEFFLSPDERGIVIKDAITLFYYLIDLNDTQTSISLGKYLSTGGFNRKGDLIAFNNIDLGEINSEPYIMTINGNREKFELTNGANYAVDPVFIPTVKNEIIYATKAKDYPDTKGLSKIIIADVKGKKLQEISMENLGLEVPVPSVDGRYVAIEAYRPDALQDYENQRSISFQAKPYDAEIIVYDLQARQLISKDFKGIEAYWE